MRARFYRHLGVDVSLWLTFASKYLSQRRERQITEKQIDTARQHWRELPSLERRAMYLYVDHGLKYPEIAVALDIAPREALRLLVNGYTSMRMRLDKDGQRRIGTDDTDTAPDDRPAADSDLPDP